MATTNIVLATPAHGAEVDTWDQPLNANSVIIDAVAGSVTTKSLTNANVTLSTTESQVSILRFTGTLTGNVIITLGAIIKTWTCENNTLGNFVITVRSNPGSGAVVGLPPGSCQIYWDGSNVAFANPRHFIGEYWDYSGSAVPSWVTACTLQPYLSSNSSTFSAITYPQLAAILGSTTTTDTRGRARFTLNAGTARLSSAGGINGESLFSGGGVGTGLTIGQTHLPSVTLSTSIGGGQGNHNHGPGGGASGFSVPASGPQSGPGGSGIGQTPLTADATLPAMSGTTPLGGSGTALASLPPGYVGGITMIRAA